MRFCTHSFVLLCLPLASLVLCPWGIQSLIRWSATSRSNRPPSSWADFGVALTPHENLCPTVAPHASGTPPRGARHATGSLASSNCRFSFGSATSELALAFPRLLRRSTSGDTRAGRLTGGCCFQHTHTMRLLQAHLRLVHFQPLASGLALALILPSWGAPASAHERGPGDSSNQPPRLLMGN